MIAVNGSVSGGALPDGNSPTLQLRVATPEQARQCWEINGDEWKGPLSKEAYFRRELHLASQPLTRNGGTTYWILVDSNDKRPDPTILASCESYRKKAFVTRRNRPGEVDEVISHGIGSVFCRDEHRGKGYAGRMMEELAKTLRTWQQEEGKQATFNVLYSDIGKKFYAKRGWVPFPSSHIALPSLQTASDSSLPPTRPLTAQNLPVLCEADVAQLRRSMSRFEDTEGKVKVAFVPEYDLIQWNHSREEFVSQETLGRNPEVKGAIVGSEPGRRVWCIWNRTFDANPADSKLHITRLVVEESPSFLSGVNPSGMNGTNGSTESASQVDAIAACLRAAQLEAARWNMSKVEIWNPAVLTLEAACKLHDGVRIVDREEDSVASLLWYGSKLALDEIEWVGNEKYGWC